MSSGCADCGAEVCSYRRLSKGFISNSCASLYVQRDASRALNQVRACALGGWQSGQKRWSCGLAVAGAALMEELKISSCPPSSSARGQVSLPVVNNSSSPLPKMEQKGRKCCRLKHDYFQQQHETPVVCAHRQRTSHTHSERGSVQRSLSETGLMISLVRPD